MWVRFPNEHSFVPAPFPENLTNLAKSGMYHLSARKFTHPGAQPNRDPDAGSHKGGPNEPRTAICKDQDQGPNCPWELRGLGPHKERAAKAQRPRAAVDGHERTGPWQPHQHARSAAQQADDP